MKQQRSKTQWPSRLAAVGLLALGMALPASGATLNINARIEVRPLTPQEKKDYSITSLQGASGLQTIGIGQPAYLEVLIANGVPRTDVTNVSWTLAAKPIGSAAELEADPLPADMPTHEMSDRSTSHLVGRFLLRPDVVGQYTVTATVETASNGTVMATNRITAATYMGVNTCALCHSGGVIADDKFTPWSQTGHATFFTRAIDGLASDHYAAYCISCHTVGYDANPLAVNGGFDDLAKQLNWTFPATLTNGNWAAMPAQLKNLSNVQCENCHGPGSEHATSLGAIDKISTTFDAGMCGQCHDSKPQHIRNIEWNQSRHAIATGYPTGLGREGCVRCHSAVGFTDYLKGLPIKDPSHEPIACAACHEPHDQTNPHQLRTSNPVTLADKTVITKGGNGLLCMNCHMARREAVSYVANTTGSGNFGPHYGTQADMLAGVNGYTYGKQVGSSTHKDVVEESCVQCHMQEVPMTSPAWTKVGSHTFKLTWEGDATNAPVHLTEACAECHGETHSFDMVRQDFNGDGVIEGVQTEVKHLLDELGRLLPPLGSPEVVTAASYTKQQLSAAWNYKFVKDDGSYGVHNLAYAVGLLKASIADLTGDANNDTLPDAWQVQYFGSANNPSAAPNATPAGDGIPNWLKYSLGLDPTVPGVVMPDGVVWVNGKTTSGGIIDPSNTNSIVIYTAAEVVFNTEVGKNYQIQSTSSFSGGWQNIGQPIAGTGAPVSYVTPTRDKVQQFYRVQVQ